MSCLVTAQKRLQREPAAVNVAKVETAETVVSAADCRDKRKMAEAVTKPHPTLPIYRELLFLFGFRDMYRADVVEHSRGLPHDGTLRAGTRKRWR